MLADLSRMIWSTAESGAARTMWSRPNGSLSRRCPRELVFAEGVLPAVDRAEAEEAVRGVGRVGGKDLTKRIESRQVHIPQRRITTCPLRAGEAVGVRGADERVPLHLAVRGGADGLCDFRPADRVPIGIRCEVKDAGIGLIAFRNLERDGAELAAQPWFDPGSRRGTIDDGQILAKHGLNSRRGEHLAQRNRPTALDPGAR